jgi:hypothetical protein
VVVAAQDVASMTCAICNQEGHAQESCPSALKSTAISPAAKHSPRILLAIGAILLLTLGGAVGVYFLGDHGAPPSHGPVSPNPVSTTKPLR